MQEFEQRILDYLNRPGYKPIKSKSLAKKLDVTKKQDADFLSVLAKLVDAGRIKEKRNGDLRVRPQSQPGLISGIIKRISSGAGYCIPHKAVLAAESSASTSLPKKKRRHVSTRREGSAAKPTGDLFISKADLRDAHTGDEVLVKLLQRRHSGGKRCGRVVEVVQRATSCFVGTYLERDGQGFVQVDGTTFPDPVAVGDPGAKRAQPDDKVVIEMLRFPSHAQSGEAVLTRVLGPRGEPGVDTQSIIHEFGLPDEFPDKVLADARLQAERFDETNLRGRLDLTNETTITIDPPDARDFDDAISLSRTNEGHWRLGVHIADVAHFVRPGSPLDREARKRGTSVYLPENVIPMLPEVISNGLASLQQGRVRFTKSAFIEFTDEGVPVHTEFVNSAIKVSRRFAYDEVLPIIHDTARSEGAPSSSKRKRIAKPIRELLVRMHELAIKLRARRFTAGSLELNLREVKLQFDKQGRVTGATEVAHDESHQMIEEFMLAANIAVATELQDRKIRFLRRTHGDPDLVKMKAFAEFVSALGFKMKRVQSRHDLQDLLNRVKGQPEEHAINYALLRSLKQAEYSAVATGHYALAVENYCHFTSPIRRYPDLTVHRLLEAIVKRGKSFRGENEVELMKLALLCSTTERRAAQAERELTKVKLLTFMEGRIGDELDAVITGVERFGIFCQGIEIPAEGLIHISWLSEDDYFYYDAATFSLIGRRSGQQYRLGDRIRVQVAHVDIDRRVLDFRIASSKTRREKTSNRKMPTSDSGKPRSTRKTVPKSSRSKRSADSQLDSRGRKRTSRPPRKNKAKRRRGKSG